MSAPTGGVKTIGVLIRGDNTSLRQALQQSKGEIAAFARTTNDSMRTATTGIRGATDGIVSGSGKATAALRGTTSAAQQMGSAATGSLSGLMSVVGRFAGPLGLGAILGQIGRVGIGFHDFSQRATISLTTMLGSAGQAKEFLADILAFAKTTPFAFPELTASAQRLLAFGVNAEKIIPTLRALGDAAASSGSGVEMVSRLAGVVGQIQAKGRLQGDEILQLAEAGIPALRILANQAGVTAAVFSKQVSAGLIDSNTAIDGLVDGLENGTTGLNGTTVAFGGLMDQIKGSGGWTSTMDSAKSGFRNMSAALTDSLMPSLTSSIRLGTDLMGVVGSMAGFFNELPKPVRDTALALTAVAVANRLVGSELRTAATGGLTMFNDRMRLQQHLAQMGGREIGRTTAAMSVMAMTARSTGLAVVGAFGGPIGIALAAATAAFAAYSDVQATAKARVDEVAGTLDEVTGKITENTRAWVKNSLAAEQGWGLWTRESGFDAAEKLGLDLDVMTDAATGSVDALRQIRSAVQDIDPAKIPELAAAAGMSTQDYLFAMRDVTTAVKGSNATIDEAIRVAEQKRRADGEATEQVGALGRAYRLSGAEIAAFSEEQVKAQDAAAEAARRAFDSATSLTKMDLNTSTAKDLAEAQDKVADATRRVRDAEVARQESADREGVTANDKIRAEEAVTEARKALEEATAAAAETESRSDPVANYRRQVEEMLTTAQTFVANVQALADEGLNGKTLSEIIAAGPEGSKDQVNALLTDTSLIGLTNSTRVETDKLGGVLESQARLAQQAASDAGGLLGSNLSLALKIAAEEGTSGTVQAIADKLSAEPETIRAVGRLASLTFLEGFEDALGSSVMTKHADGTYSTTAPKGSPVGYWTGGIYPGYTPGTDIGYIGVSGGEAIMRPEWTRAMGAEYVNLMNRVALQGPSAVRQAHSRYMGGFASGGVAGAYQSPAPQVITVPVSSTHENNVPVTIQSAVFTDPHAAATYGARARARANTGG